MKFRLTEEFNKLNMSGDSFITDSEYKIKDLLMNKPKLYRILYDSKIDRWMIGDGNDIIHSDMFNQAYKEGYYYDVMDFIMSIGSIQNYWELGTDGGFVDDSDENSEELDPYLFCFYSYKC